MSGFSYYRKNVKKMLFVLKEHGSILKQMAPNHFFFTKIKEKQLSEEKYHSWKTNSDLRSRKNWWRPTAFLHKSYEEKGKTNSHNKNPSNNDTHFHIEKVQWTQKSVAWDISSLWFPRKCTSFMLEIIIESRNKESSKVSHGTNSFETF